MKDLEQASPASVEFEVYELELVDAPPETSFDNLTDLAATLLQVPIAMVTVVQFFEDRQYFKSCRGLPAAYAQSRQSALSHSFCQHVKRSNAPLILTDVKADASHRDNGAVQDLGIGAYIGVPIHLPDGSAVGSLAVADSTARDWSEGDLRALLQLGRCVNEQIALKKALKDTEQAEDRAHREAVARKLFLSHMTHEIRTPLNGIIGAVDLLSGQAFEGSTSPEQKTLIRTIDGSAQNLLRLLNDALDLAKIDAGKMELEELVFDLPALAQEITNLYRPMAHNKGIELHLSLSDIAEGEHRLGDAFRLQQVLSNILSNAIKFTESGNVALSLTGQGNQLNISVEDTGCGMTPEQMAGLFDPFMQADVSVARTSGGTGLGMSIVKKLVDLMGGEIEASSEAGHGTQFHLSFPLPRRAAPKAETLEPLQSDQPFANHHILIADDGHANRVVLSKMLQSLGASVLMVENGVEALKAVHREAFDMLFIDIHMPQMNGTTFARTLRETPPNWMRNNPALLVAVTANVFPEQIDSYYKAGFDVCVAKPLRREAIVKLTT